MNRQTPREQRLEIPPAQKAALVTLSLAAFTLAFLLVGLDRPLPDSDDALFAWSIRDAVESGRWLEYQWFGVSFQLAYPPLGYLLAAISARLVGASEFGIRLTPVLCSWAALMVAFFMARRLTQSLLAGALAALCLVSLGVYYYFAHTAGVDGCLTLCLALTMWLAMRAIAEPRCWKWAGAAAGAAIMTKGMAGALPVVGILLALLMAKPRPGARHLGAATLAACIVALPWHAAQLIRHGSVFFDNYIGYNVVGRSTARIVGGDSSFLFYVTELIEYDPVIGTLVLVTALGVVVHWIRQRDATLAPVVGAAVLPLLVFSASETRLLKYLMPGLLPLCVLAAVGIYKVIGRYKAAPLVLLAPTLVFFVHTVPRMSASPLAPGHRELAVAAQGFLKSDQTLLVMDDYHAATAYYSDRPIELVTPDQGVYDILMAIPGLRASGTVRYVDAGALAELFASRAPRVILADERYAALIASSLARAGVASRSQAEGDYVLFWEADP